MGGCRMDVQLAEFAAEGEMLLRRDVLVAEENHEIFGKRAVDFIHLPVGARIVRDKLADVDARNLGANDRRQLLDADGLVGLDFAGDVPIAGPLLAGQRAHGRSPNRS